MGIVLSTNIDHNWCDIERAIKDWLVKDDGMGADKTLAYLDGMLRLNSSATDQPVEVARFLLSKTPSKAAASRKALYSTMLRELNQLEYDFGLYLSHALKVTPDYDRNAETLREQLIDERGLP